MEIKISQKPVAYKKAIDFLEQRVEKVHANLEDELIWILEHDSVYTKGISASDKDLLLPNLFPVIVTNRGGKFTYHGPGQKIVYFVINLNKREKEIKKFGAKKIDYLSAFNLKKLKKTNKPSVNTRVFLAYYLNNVRLIDNF